MLKYLNNILILLCIIFIMSCNKDSAKQYYNKSIKKIEAKEYNKALTLMNQAIELDSTYAKAYFIRAQIYDLLNRDKSNFCQDLKKAKQLGFKRAQKVYNQYCIKRSMDKYYKLKREFNEYIEKNPHKFEGYFDRANLNFDYGFYKKAIKDYNKVLEIKEYSVAYFNRGLSYNKINKRDKACRDIKKAAKLGYDKAKKTLKFCK